MLQILRATFQDPSLTRNEMECCIWSVCSWTCLTVIIPSRQALGVWLHGCGAGSELSNCTVPHTTPKLLNCKLNAHNRTSSLRQTIVQHGRASGNRYAQNCSYSIPSPRKTMKNLNVPRSLSDCAAAPPAITSGHLVLHFLVCPLPLVD